LVTHLARKTFATTIALTNGMNIGVLSKILGHNSIKLTLDSYGTIIDELMLSNVRVLKEKLSMKKEELTQNGKDKLSQPHDDLISQIKNGSKN